jgi:hypothetical protein
LASYSFMRANLKAKKRSSMTHAQAKLAQVSASYI